MTDTANVFADCYQALMIKCPLEKARLAQQIYGHWLKTGIADLATQLEVGPPVLPIPIPGRPEKPALVPPKQLKQRKLTTPKGRAALLHAIAHIEFNAINLALDAVYRFRNMPAQFYLDWLQVAAEEAKHFKLLEQRLVEMGYAYGDLPAHNGLWEQAHKTAGDVLVRMALVPRVLEARGLDVTPAMLQRLDDVGDEASCKILKVILTEEVGHVRIGSYWFHYCCEQRGLPSEETFIQLVRDYMHTPPRGPFNIAAREEAGFSKVDMQTLVQLEREWLAELRDPTQALRS